MNFYEFTRILKSWRINFSTPVYNKRHNVVVVIQQEHYFFPQKHIYLNKVSGNKFYYKDFLDVNELLVFLSNNISSYIPNEF
jgi:hypothetical protein